MTVGTVEDGEGRPVMASNHGPHEETPGIACGRGGLVGDYRKRGGSGGLFVNTGNWNKKSEAVMVASCGG